MKVIYDEDQQRIPVKAWLSDLDDLTLEQALNMARLPFAAHHVALMPDAHPGYGMCIGGVLAASNFVVPHAVGVDIGCFTADTLIPTLDGTSRPIGELAARDDEFPVYACTPSARITVARATARMTRRNARLVQVTLDNGEVIRCTPDHEFKLRDGSFAMAADLSPGTSLMPFYSMRDRDGYTMIQQPYSGRWQRAHWMVARAGLLGDVPRFDGQRTVIHHRNFDESDNRPANLVFMSAGAHSSLHRSFVERNEHWQSPEFEKRRIAAVSARARTSEGRRILAEIGTANILRYMKERPEHFRQAAAGNGQRGKDSLVAYNTSEKGRAKSKEIANRIYTCEVCGDQAKSGFGIHNHRRRVHKTNHTVVSVEAIPEREDVYCLTVPEYGNFALSAGVFVHNCGMHARRTNIEAGRMRERHRGEGTVLRAVLSAIQRNVPAGNGPAGNHSAPQVWETPLADPEVVALLDGAPPELAKAWERSVFQIGTLGGGNHFQEIQEDEEGFVWLMLHSGSRALGRHVCDYFDAEARAYAERHGQTEAIAAQLAGLPVASPQGEAYLAWMRLCMAYALENRRRMLDAGVEALFGTVRGVAPEREYLITEAVDTHHNFAELEAHFGEEVYVHRKGAVRARAGEMVIIPGSMETGSYIARGKGNLESFETCSHGAGRRLSRNAAKRERTAEDVLASLQAKGIALAKRGTADVAEEAGHAYKPIEGVLRDSADLVEPVYKLKPLGVMKG